MATTGCTVRKAAAPGAGQGRAKQPPPASLPAAGSRAQELPEVGELKRTCARSPCSGLQARGIPGVAGAPVPGKMPGRLPSPPSNLFRKSCKPKSQSGPSPAPLPPLPPTPPAEAAYRPALSSAPTLPWTLISMATLEDSLGGGRHPKSSTVSSFPAASSGDSAPGATLAQVLLPINCLGGGGKGAWSPPPLGGWSAAGPVVRWLGSGVHQHHPCVQV